jgi:hypothetical protein
MLLPPSFDLVVLGKKERAAVVACGKNPDRKEADVLNGLPVNTEYVPENKAAPAPSAPEQLASATPSVIPEAQMDPSLQGDAQAESAPA